MASATLEMFIKIVGARKVSSELDNISNSLDKTNQKVNNASKQNAQFSAGMSSLTKGAIAGAAIFAGKKLLDFAQDSILAASAAQEAAGAFGTTFGGAAESLGQELEKNANLFGLTTSQAKQLVGVFGAVAQGIGFTQQESADLSARLFELSGDIASFNNISSGAEPVLQAFRSALVGEREALKTYGIAITEAEVQTKAFEMTGKRNADELTRQEKALATTELLFEKAAVQIGNAERESEGFAAQMLQTKAKTQQFREELGEQLLPAAGALLGFFNDFIDVTAPLVVGAFENINTVASKFGELNSIIWDDATDSINEYGESIAKNTPEILTYLGYLLTGQMAYYNKNKDKLDEVTKESEKYSDSLDENTEVANKNSVAIFGATGYSQDFLNTVQGINDLYDYYNTNLQQNRNQLIVNTTQTGKFADTIDKKLNPIFGEQNALLLTNIQLETNRNTLMKLINSANEDLSAAQTNYNNALKEVNRLTIEENVRDAEAAIRKAELQTQIALLTEAQNNGKDVSLDLALAQAELAQAEYELANDSDALKSARNLLTVSEQNLTIATENQQKVIEERNKELVRSIDLTNQQANANKNLANTITGLAGTDFGRLVSQGFVTLGAPAEGVETPADTLGDNSNISGGGNGGTDTTLIVQNYIGEEKIEEVIQKVNTRIQQQGKTFRLER